MSFLDEDLEQAATGDLSREALLSRHPGSDADRLLDLHHNLLDVGRAAVMIPEWRDVAPRLVDRSGRWGSARRRAFLAAAVAGAGLIIVPIAADAMEAVAPDAVRDTVIDTITDVLPWDNDAVDIDSPAGQPTSDVPGSDRSSDRSDRSGAAETDGQSTDLSVDRSLNDRSDATGSTDHAPTDDSTTATDTPDDRRPAGETATDGARDESNSVNPTGQGDSQPGSGDGNVGANDAKSGFGDGIAGSDG